MVTLRLDGTDADGLAFDPEIHHETENQAIAALKAACLDQTVKAALGLQNAHTASVEAELAYERAVLSNADCLQRYSYDSTRIE